MKVLIVGTGLMAIGILKAISNIKNIDVSIFSQSKNKPNDVIQKTYQFKYIENLKPSLEFDLIIESTHEDLNTKKKIINSLQTHFTDVPIYTNTSSFSIHEVSAASKFPEKIAGLHFMNPPKYIKFVEVVFGKYTDENTKEIAFKFLDEIERDFVIAPDKSGFIVNRLLMAQIIEAINLLDETNLSALEIDEAFSKSTLSSSGPLKTADYIGLDVVEKICMNLAKNLDEKFKPPTILSEYVKKSEYGLKSKKGFYNYE